MWMKDASLFLHDKDWNLCEQQWTAEPSQSTTFDNIIDHNGKIMHDGLYLKLSFLIWKWYEIPPTLFSHSWALKVIQFIKMAKKKQSWHLCIDSFIWSTQTAAFILICASLLEIITKCLYFDGSCCIKKNVKDDDHICFYCDVFTCSSHLHRPHSVSRDMQIVLKGIYVLTSTQSWRQLSISLCISEHLLEQCKLMVERQFNIIWFYWKSMTVIKSNLCTLTCS